MVKLPNINTVTTTFFAISTVHLAATANSARIIVPGLSGVPCTKGDGPVWDSHYAWLEKSQWVLVSVEGQE